MRIFISYARSVAPDKAVALQVAMGLQPVHAVFVDPGELRNGWAERVASELQQAEIVIVLLSPAAVQSEVVTAEVAQAVQTDGPLLIPVRLAYTAPFPYPLNHWLEHRACLTWQTPDDTGRLLEALHRVLVAGTLPLVDDALVATSTTVQTVLPSPIPNAALELPDGTMDPQSAFYVVRPADALALQIIQRQGVTLTIKAPRQMGKSSLLLRVAKAATAHDKRVALLDFQLIDSAALASAEVFLRQFCAWLSYQLKIPDQVADYWQLPLGNIQRCTAYVEDHLLPTLGQPLVLAIDEADKLFDSSFRSDFFGMLRGWHNRRQAHSIWRQLDLVLVTSTEPYQLVANLNQSPFNVGQVVDLEDFTLAQVSDLNARHKHPFTRADEGRLITLLGGQPYLVRQALYIVASGRLTSATLFTSASDERGPFGDHLRHHLLRLQNSDELVAGLHEVLKQQRCSDEHTFFRLRGAGLVKRAGKTVIPRCQLYADFFQAYLTSPPIPLSQKAERGNKTRPASGTAEALSGRELDVLDLLADGLSNAQIAERLVISVGTVNTHLNTLYGKLGVNSRTAAVRQAQQLGLV